LGPDGFGLVSTVEVLGLLSVGEGVVVSAEETKVVEDGFASVCPEDNVMDVAPAGGPATAFVGAVAVPGDDGSA
jgi:hypothetical protein